MTETHPHRVPPGARPTRSRRAAALAALAFSGCTTLADRPGATAPRPRSSAERPAAIPPPDLAVPGLDESALLLLLVDRQIYEPFTVSRSLRSGLPGLRRELGAMLGRAPDPAALPVLEELARDPDPGVRRAAAFAAGRIGGAEAGALLEGLLLDPDDEVGAWASRGLALLGAPLDRVANRLAGLGRESRQARLLPDLERFAAARGSVSYGVLAREGLTATDPWLRRRALAALVASGVHAAERPVLLRLLAEDRDPALRAAVAAALGPVGRSEDLGVLLAAARDPGLAVVVAAVGAAGAIVRAGRAAPPEDWRSELVGLLADPRPAVRAAAIAAAPAWLLDPELESALEARLREGGPGERGRALVALAAAQVRGAGDLVTGAAHDPDPWVRAAAARAASTLGASALAARLGTDDAALVRAAAYRSLAGTSPPPSPELHAHFLGDPAAGVRTVVLAGLERRPVLPFELLLAAFAKQERRAPELALVGVDALRARAEATPTERGSIVAALEGLAEVGGYPVRVRAADALAALGRPRPSLGPATTAHGPGDYRSVAARTRRARWVRLETERGSALVRIDAPTAPLASVAFFQLLEQGFYDGSVVYRVEPAKRLEAGDPDGDGHGGPGFTLRDEPGPARLRAGAVGLVRPAPHASGSRFFVQLGEDAELEGEATVLGQVVEGLELLASLLEGDRLLAVREVAAPP